MTLPLTPKFNVGDFVCRDPDSSIGRIAFSYVIDTGCVLYIFTNLKGEKMCVPETEMRALSAHEEADLKKKRAEDLKKNMLASIEAYQAFLTN